MYKPLLNFKRVVLTLTLGAALTGCYTDKTVSVLVQTPTGASIPNADIIVDDKTYKTDANGVASFKVQVPKSAKQVVVNFKKEGFVNQSVLYDIPTAKNINVSASLLPIKQTITVDQIELAQTIESKELHAKIDIPASAFVLQNGKVATGKISVDFTPWDITSSDLNAMPANGVAKDKSGKIVNLISAGMISATFKNAAGQELQLARNKSADIQMDLPLKSINNQEMKAGVSIPMWHFDEAQGLWVEEGTGYVVDSDKSSTGLAVTAKVSHFSTWNWDYKFAASGSVFVQCQSKGVGVPCNVVAKVTLNDGSGFTQSNALPAEGLTVVNMPSNGSIRWTAKDVTGTLIGEKTSGTTGNVIIDLGTPTTDNTVKCTLADGTAVACSGKLNNEFDFSVSKDGGKIISTLKDDDGQLDWRAQSSLIFDNGEWVRFKGMATSSMNGNVIIYLTDREIVYETEKGLSFKVMCMKDEVNGDSSPWMQIDWTGKSCEVEVQVYSSIDGSSESFYFNGIYNQPIQINLPEKYSGFSYDQSGIVSSISVTGTLLVNDWLLGTRVYLEGSEDRNQIIPLYMGPWW
nr:astroprincin family protein [Acinetobacter sp. Marseille-Q1620]